ncbi:hypothetical protein BZA70DRAFT_275977 [Myxozyma melibiosi]|uniref:Uncharacterized protein n=1 Tax=Myxozyma melibiosi TaxID=54550 RepID=A0ABR1FAP5_9ASCO
MANVRAAMNWVFDANGLDETTIDEKLRQEGIDISYDNLPDSPAPAAWALQALPAFITGTPKPKKWISNHDVEDMEVDGEQGNNNVGEEEPLLFDEQFYRDLDQQKPQSQPNIQPRVEPQHQQQQPGVFRPKESLRSNLLRKLAKTAVSEPEKENRNPDGVLQQPQLPTQNGPKSLANDTLGSVVPSLDTPTRLPHNNTRSRQPQPAGILRTPGTATSKKVVSFAPAEGGGPVDELATKGLRIRSGLPRNFPGKFPSPWTPKSVIDRLDLADTPTTSFARRAEIERQKQEAEVSKLKPESESKAGPTTKQTKAHHQKSRRKSFSEAETKQLTYVFETLASNNQGLEALLTQKVISNAQQGAQSNTVSEEAEYWRKKYEEAEEEKNETIKLMEESQQHMDMLLIHAKEKEQQIAELRRQLEQERKSNLETCMRVLEMQKDMQSLKEASKKALRRRLAEIAAKGR